MSLQLFDKDGLKIGDSGFPATISNQSAFTNCSGTSCDLDPGKTGVYAITQTSSSPTSVSGYGRLDWSSSTLEAPSAIVAFGCQERILTESDGYRYKTVEVIQINEGRPF